MNCRSPGVLGSRSFRISPLYSPSLSIETDVHSPKRISPLYSPSLSIETDVRLPKRQSHGSVHNQRFICFR